MVKTTRIGIVGLGWVARDYMLPAIAAAGERAELTAVLSLREEDFADLPNSVRCFNNLDEFLAADLVDAVYIATPNHLHREQTIACLDAGLHVLCEKPLALTPDAVSIMKGAAERNQRLLVTAYDQRHHPAHREMRNIIRAGKLGTITQARIDYACWLPKEWSGDNWRINRKKAGGGAIIDLAPHGLDLLEWLLEDPIAEVHCFQQSLVQNYSVDDGGVLSIRFESGTLAAQTVGYNRPETLPRRKLEIIGTQGMLTAENTMGQDAGGQLTFTDAETGTTENIPFDAKTGPFTHQLTNFLDRIHQAPTDNTELEATLRQVNLLHRALRISQPPAPKSLIASRPTHQVERPSASDSHPRYDPYAVLESFANIDVYGSKE
ncbi:Gfo/Idh/MocA family protein [Neolewinella antarctica]|uniref:Dehydrogenase n=1 Tax=Neolewinella antarctica TaxID=442734 RepID=A0ABX0XG88_9BACT|nr:Gfo/Idh/MocA family oxidoreductase [Neolewinella antarctica]NJC28160.1 putative dehydrogenase [Neolewinella antarctica]